MGNTFIRFFYKRLFFMVPLWYGFTMFLTRWRRWRELPVYRDPAEIAEALDGGSGWRPDPLKGVLDVLMDPRKFQSRIDAGEEKLGDCDDHAMFWATTLLQGGLADRAWLGSVWYVKPGQKRGTGHVVCIYEWLGKSYWCDYGTPQANVSPWGWAYAVALDRGAAPLASGMVEVRLRRRGNPKFRIRGAQGKTYP